QPVSIRSQWGTPYVFEQRVGHHQLRLGHLAERQADDVRFGPAAAAIDCDQDLALIEPFQRTAEPPPATDRLCHLDLRLVPGPADEVAWPHQRPIDARRRDLELVRSRHRILDVQQRPECPADQLAILEAHRAVGTFRHHLQRAAARAGDPDPYQPASEGLDYRFRQARNTFRRSRLAADTRFLPVRAHHYLAGRNRRLGSAHWVRLTKKRTPQGPPSTQLRGRPGLCENALLPAAIITQMTRPRNPFGAAAAQAVRLNIR